MATAASSFSAASNPGNERFNAEAAAWDSNPFVHRASSLALKAILARFPTLKPLAPGSPNLGLDILEIGCGTGLLSVIIAPYAHHVVAIDAAHGMIEVLKQKLSKPETPKNITPVCVLLADPEDPHLPPASQTDPNGPRQKFDLITSHLVLHHIPELQPVLETMLGALKPGGSVALTDFEDFGPDARKFHPKSHHPGVERHGIHAQTMHDLMRQVGFTNVRVERAFSVEKSVENFEGEFGDRAFGKEGQGTMMDFPFVICMGERSR